MEVTTQQLGGSLLSMDSTAQTGSWALATAGLWQASWWLLTASGPARESFHNGLSGYWTCRDRQENVTSHQWGLLSWRNCLREVEVVTTAATNLTPPRVSDFPPLQRGLAFLVVVFFVCLFFNTFAWDYSHYGLCCVLITSKPSQPPSSEPMLTVSWDVKECCFSCFPSVFAYLQQGPICF